ncbi:choice-of-anchor G family protein, partial [Georgenia sp. MJ278]
MAEPTDDSEARAQLIAVDGLGLDVLDAIRTESGNLSSPGPNRADIDAEVLEGLIGLEIGALDIPLIADGDGGLLDLGGSAAAGLLNGYAASPSDTSSIAASGLVTADGALDFDAATDGTDFARLDLTAVLGQLDVDGVTDAVVDDLSLGLGAFASRAATDPADSSYILAGAELRISSPLVGALVGDIDTAVDVVDTTLDGVLGPEGTVQGALDLVDLPDVTTGLLDISLGSPTLDASVDLDAVTAGLLAEPLVSDDDLVTIDLASGVITVDLARLHGGDLNGLGPNTQLLTAAEVTRITDTVSELLGEVTGIVTDAVDTAIGTTSVSLTLSPSLSAIGGIVAGDIAVEVDGSLADFLGTTETDPVISITGSVQVGLITIPLNAIGAVVEPVVEGLLETVGTLLGPVLAQGDALVTTAVGGLLSGVLTTIDPLLGALDEVVTMTINEQPTEAPIGGSGDLGDESFTVRALAIDLLPDLAGVGVELASSTVRASEVEATVVASPDPVEVGETVTVDGELFVPGETVTIVYTDSSGDVVATQEQVVGEDGSFTDTLIIPAGTPTGSLVITADDGTRDATDSVTVTDVGAGTDVDGTDVDGTDVDGTDVDGTDVDGTDVDGTDVDGTDVDGTDVDGTDVDGTDVDGTDVDGTDVDGTDVDGTDVDGTDVDGTDVDGTDVDGTDVDGTDVDGTDVDGTDVDG